MADTYTLAYSFHLSTKSHAVTNIAKVNSVSRHNLRAYKSDKFDRNLIDVLVGSDKSILSDVRRIYHEEFDDALAEYNAKQTRDDRKIKDYLKHVSDSQSDCACEIIIQLGDRDFWDGVELDERKKMTAIFEDQVAELQATVPELKIASAVVHYDESSPHMHIVGIPVADGFRSPTVIKRA